mgnify:CR=1 FL=1
MHACGVEFVSLAPDTTSIDALSTNLVAAVAAAPKRRSLEQALGYFDSLDEDRDGEVTREEAREGWGRFSEMGFGEEQVVTRREFQDAMAPRFAADANACAPDGLTIRYEHVTVSRSVTGT